MIFHLTDETGKNDNHRVNKKLHAIKKYNYQFSKRWLKIKQNTFQNPMESH